MPPLEADGRNYHLHRQAWENLYNAGIKYLSVTARMPLDISAPKGDPVATQKEWLREFDFKLSSIHYHGPAYARLDNMEGQNLVQNKLVEFIKLYSELSPYAIVLHAGGILGVSSNLDAFNAFRDSCRKFGYDKTLCVIAENIAIMADEAAKYDMKIAIENMGKLLPVGDMKSLEQLILLTNHRNLGFCIDSGHAHCFGERVVAWLEFAGKRLFETHFHDNNAKAANIPDEFVAAKGIDEHLFPGLGTIDWREVIKRLDAVGYVRPVMFECLGLPAQNLVEGYKKAAEWWRNQVSTARRS